MKKFFVLLLSICLFAFVSACANGQNTNSDEQNSTNGQTEDDFSNNDSGENQPTKEKFIIDLSLDNYLTYFEISENVQQIYPALRVNGCLSFALYENVSFTISNGETQETFYCNAAGNGASQMGGGNVEIVQVSGQVIYWM